MNSCHSTSVIISSCSGRAGSAYMSHVAADLPDFDEEVQGRHPFGCT